MNELLRTEILIGKDNLKKLKDLSVLIFGVGGVGSFSAESLARCGVGNITLVDHDYICRTNINRQIHALDDTVDDFKVDIMKIRIGQINKSINVRTFKHFYLPDDRGEIFDYDYDYIIDAIDTVSAKIDIIEQAKNLNIPIISSMGTGNKLDPSKLKVGDIKSTTMCPLAKVMRKELKKRNIKNVDVIFSDEKPIKPEVLSQGNKKQVPGTVSFLPSTAGILAASYVVNKIINIKSI